ncbi:MAG: F0F1 ATP synthase subunit A [Bacteriovoracaceae bacterium]
MKKILSLGTLLFSANLYAAGGFTWISTIQNLFGTHIAEYIITYSFVGLVLIAIGLLYRTRMAKVPNAVIPDKGITLRNLSELYGQFIYSQCKAVIGEKEADKYFGFISTIFIVILFSNVIGLIPGFLPPTEYLNTTLALGVFSFIYYNFVGAREVGFINYLKHFAGPLWYMAILIFPIEIISNFIRPISLALRLRGNMYGDHLVLVQFSDLAPLIVPIAAMLLGLLVCFIQAYVFTVLSMVYISLAVAHHDHDEHAHH